MVAGKRTLSQERNAILHLDILQREMVREVLVGGFLLVVNLVEVKIRSPKNGDELSPFPVEEGREGFRGREGGAC
jgi:hypothetical protein